MRNERLDMIREVFSGNKSWVVNLPPDIEDAIRFLLSELDMREKHNQTMLEALEKIVASLECRTLSLESLHSIAQAAIDAVEGGEKNGR